MWVGTGAVRAAPGSAALATLRIPVPKRAAGVVRAKTYAEALARARREKRDLVVLVHGSDWCRIGETFRRNVWENREFARRLGNGFVLFEADVPEHPSTALKKRLARRQKGFSSKFGNYPVLVFIDPGGRRYATISGYATLTRPGFPGALAQAVKVLHELQRAREIRDYCLARAAKVRGADQAEWLFRAWQAGADRREEIVTRLDRADPENRTGYPARVRFDGYAVLVKAKGFGDAKKFSEGVRWLRAEAAKNGMTPEQKQWIYTALGNLYRRWPGHDAQAWKAFMKSVRIDPNTIMGRAASRLARRFVGPPTLEFGWQPRHCSVQGTTWKIDASQAVTARGTYRLTFEFQRGRSTLTIEKITLKEGARTIAAVAAAPVNVGPKNRRAEFRFRVPLRLRRACFEVRCRTRPKTDSSGTIDLDFIGSK